MLPNVVPMKGDKASAGCVVAVNNRDCICLLSLLLTCRVLSVSSAWVALVRHFSVSSQQQHRQGCCMIQLMSPVLHSLSQHTQHGDLTILSRCSPNTFLKEWKILYSRAVKEKHVDCLRHSWTDCTDSDKHACYVVTERGSSLPSLWYFI